MTTNYERRGSADLERLIPRVDDPPAEVGKVLIYSRLIDSGFGAVLRTLARFPNGTVTIIL